MTIVFDPKQKRSTHVESGLSVQWVHDEPPLEFRKHFKLIIDDKEIPFESSYDYGEGKIDDKYPNASILEKGCMISELKEINYNSFNIKCDFDKEIFIETWGNLVSQGMGVSRVSTYYTEINGAGPASKKTWSCEG